MKAIYLYGWDLLDEGVGEVAAVLRGIGADTIALASSYHAGKFVRPHGRLQGNDTAVAHDDTDIRVNCVVGQRGDPRRLDDHEAGPILGQCRAR